MLDLERRYKIAPRLGMALVWVLVVSGVDTTGAGQSARPEVPTLPATPYEYTDAALRLPAHFTAVGPDGIAATDNAPPENPITDDGATLGRVLFYDTRLSANGAVSCGSCHLQRHGFTDPKTYSVGFDGRSTRRHAMGLSNARYYARGRFFWDERANTLEAQVLAPIQDPIEMGLSLALLEDTLRTASFYPPLFGRAFGTPAITTERIARALAQFVRALVSYRSPYDEARAAGPLGSPSFGARLSETERLGHRLFVTVPGSDMRGAGCSRCHATDAQISLSPRNIGLDPEGTGDQGAGDGRFKAPSLRNIAVGAPYMHDGRFATLREVIEHYDDEVQAQPFLDMTLLDRRLAVTGGPVRPVRLDLTDTEIDALVAFLHTLTDEAFLTDPKFSDPFAAGGSR
jgi:cytochrome c peroxidase